MRTPTTCSIRLTSGVGPRSSSRRHCPHLRSPPAPTFAYRATRAVRSHLRMPLCPSATTRGWKRRPKFPIVDPVTARKTWRTLEPLHGLIYFAPEATEEYAAIGLVPEMGGYFASRAAPMGPVPAEVVIATFFNFRPEVVHHEIPRAWCLA